MTDARLSPTVARHQARRRPRRPRASPEERAKAAAVARFTIECIPGEQNLLVALICISTVFPDIKLEAALIGHLFPKLLLREVLQ